MRMQTEKYAEGKWAEVQASDRFKLTKPDAQVNSPPLFAVFSIEYKYGHAVDMNC